jgi:hypothetical protein
MNARHGVRLQTSSSNGYRYVNKFEAAIHAKLEEDLRHASFPAGGLQCRPEVGTCRQNQLANRDPM